MATTNELAVTLKQLHQPSAPIVLPNIWDLASLRALVSLNDADPAGRPVKAVATASWAIAEASGIRDEDLTWELNRDAIAKLAPHVRAAGLPLTVDLQDGYGTRIEEVVAEAVRLGASGANIEDSIPSAGFGAGIEGSLYGTDEQTDRLRRALAAARDAGCPDFVLNARSDVFRLDAPVPQPDDETTVAEAVKRGRAYLDLGATTIFVWGGSGRGLRTSEVQTLARELDGRVAVKLGDGADALTTAELAVIGVARISVGPSLYLKAMAAVREAAARILSGGRLAA
ncbi:phosphoenolpyruvate phosphomutase-domain-containing protein [Plectosphaerella plurivora]|uniref:Phosphoenolpyruvate phosphomutase-domain-containing protein n=1 Tax=Plectosphaerella plurivora TaxID=936078 RepID=A0A9P8VJ12_9PEZI|nr:phosphoenolpyruvate phosphomutase-domain-containing protein [Plectosphaerella plurivora]